MITLIGVAIVCVTVIVLTLLGSAHSRLQDKANRAHELEMERIRASTEQALSLDKVRLRELELEQLKEIGVVQ